MSDPQTPNPNTPAENSNQGADQGLIMQAQGVLSGKGTLRGWRRILPFFGPGFIASVAYMDPGNFATNIQGGAQFGYALLWVVLLASLMAMLIQNLSAKLGIATGRNLPEVIRDEWGRKDGKNGPLVWFYWIQAELVAMATDLAEFLGAALALHLLTGLPILAGAVVTAIITFGLLGLQKRGFRPLEVAITLFVGIIGLAYLVQFIISKPTLALFGGFVPSFQGQESVYLAVGIIGATVMPHVIYLHSDLTKGRISTSSDQQKRTLARLTLVDVLVAMGIAALINMAMLASSAAALYGKNIADAGDLTQAYQTLTPLLGPLAGVTFGVALLAAGLSSSVVGTMAGQVVMQGFVRFSISIWLRRVLTMLPAFAVILMGLDATRVLVLSQVVLSFGIPFAVVPLLVFSARRDLMGVLVSARWVMVLGWLIAAVIIGLNMYLLWGLLGS